MTGQRKPAAIRASAIALARLRLAAVGLAEADAIALGVMDHAWLGDVGREIGERSDHAPRLDRGRDDAARIDALEAQPVQLTAVVLEVPPRDAVLRADDGRVGTEQRPQRRRQRRQTVRLDAEEDDVGRADRRQIAGDLRPDLEVAFGARDAQPARLHRLQVRTAREQHDVGAGLGQPRADVSADRARPRDDDPHVVWGAKACATMRR